MDMNDNNQNTDQKKESFKDRLYTNPVWIVFVLIAWYIFIAEILAYQVEDILPGIWNMSNAEYFIYIYYTITIVSVVVLYLLCLFRKNRYIWKSFLPASRNRRKAEHFAGGAAAGHTSSGKKLSYEEFSVEFYGRGNNTLRMLLMGLLLGFLTNFFCILCALLHGDIKLYFDASVSQIPVFIFALVSTFIQSSSEEMWCRGFLYERLHDKYPLWLAVVVNGVLFGLLHCMNPSVTVLSIVGITVTGVSYSLLRWYTGNIWIAFTIHTGWNFTQNFLFGLPNSGLVSEVSVFHLDAASGVTNLIYDYGFGVEGAIPAVLIDAAIGIICLLLAKRDGRLGELTQSRRKAYEEYLG